ncbi:DedA family protein [Herbidospora galbida]|uniref:DedA family protein n=1 Tax=Herbidospora galbida TaxID=2575442 RepID=A0A4U3MF94_9ACTN|nr:DedA family protein [Herbidospora galbida]TKK86954.1 DedA family protein [Herbidospora galbida]
MEKLDGIAAWVVGLMETLGAPGAGLATAIENLAPPIPSELILPLAGFTASQGNMSLVAAIAWTTAGSVAGALVLYGLGALLGRNRTVALLGRVPFVTVDDIERTEAWFARHGRKTVFFGRMVPVFRSLISIPAGVERMPLGTFTLLTALGSLIWNSIFVLAGYLLGENWEVVQRYSGWLTNGVIVVCALAVAVFLVLRVRARVR